MNKFVRTQEQIAYDVSTQTRCCSDCKERKNFSEFYKSVDKYSGIRGVCKQCANERSATQQFGKREWLRKLKEENPCNDCNQYYPYFVMEFDHRNKIDKLKDISDMWSSSKQQILEEISKCDLVCSNCHRIRTHERGDHIPFNKTRRVLYAPQR